MQKRANLVAAVTRAIGMAVLFATMLVVTESQDRIGDRGLQATGASIEVSGRIVAGIASRDTSGTGERKQLLWSG